MRYKYVLTVLACLLIVGCYEYDVDAKRKHSELTRMGWSIYDHDDGILLEDISRRKQIDYSAATSNEYEDVSLVGITGRDIGERFSDFLSKCSNVDTVAFHDCDFEGVEFPSDIPTLETLVIHDGVLPLDTLRSIGGIKYLKSLSVTGSDISNEDLEYLPRELEVLLVYDSPYLALESVDLQTLFPKLRKLFISRVDEQTLIEIQKSTKANILFDY